MAKESAQVVVDNIIGPRNKRYSFVDTEEQWYGLGFEEPKFNKGDTIQFDFTRNGRFLNVTPGTVEVVAEGEAPAPSPPRS